MSPEHAFASQSEKSVLHLPLPALGVLCWRRADHGSGDTRGSPPPLVPLGGGRVEPGTASASSARFYRDSGFWQLTRGRNPLAACCALGQSGFCGTAVTPSGHTREVPGSQEVGDHLAGLAHSPWRPPRRSSDPTRGRKGHKVSERAPLGAPEPIVKGSSRI